MSKSMFVWGAGALIVLSLGGFAGWVLSLPGGGSASAEAPPIPAQETEAMLASLVPPLGERPLVAVIGLNGATETTDYLMPTGILRRADVADVMMLATGPGLVQLYPALTVELDATIAAFDAAHPQGADYVVVPAMSRDDDPAVLGWLRSQAQKGARIISICAGAKVIAAAGLLDGRRATTHWYYLDEMLERSPTIQYIADRRMISDEDVVTTTGISASMPMMLTLIEAIAGQTKAEAVARDLGLESWDARHDSSEFRLTRPFATTVLANRMRFWAHEDLGVRLEPGMEEVTLARVADAWSRTYRSGVETFTASANAVETRNGIRIVPDKAGADLTEARQVDMFPDRPPAEALDQALEAIAARFGERTTNVVAMQLEYPRHGRITD